MAGAQQSSSVDVTRVAHPFRMVMALEAVAELFPHENLVDTLCELAYNDAAPAGVDHP